MDLRYRSFEPYDRLLWFDVTIVQHEFTFEFRYF
jgi:hypothetical protein